MSEQRRRILLIDDDETILETVRLALESHGYDVEVARDGAAGIRRAEHRQPDLIVLDLVLPNRNGFAVLERIRKSLVSPPRVIMLTGSGEDRYRQAAEARGADAFLPKPVDMALLLARIAELLA